LPSVCLLLTYSFFLLVSYVFLHLCSSISLPLPCLAFLFSLHVKKCLPLIFLSLFPFSRSDFKTDFFSPPETLFHFLLLFLCFSFSSQEQPFAPSPPQAGLPAQNWEARRLSTHGETVSGDTAGEVAGDITPLALAYIESVFFESLQRVE